VSDKIEKNVACRVEAPKANDPFAAISAIMGGGEKV
jgi:hypothetical protein